MCDLCYKCYQIAISGLVDSTFRLHRSSRTRLEKQFKYPPCRTGAEYLTQTCFACKLLYIMRYKGSWNDPELLYDCRIWGFHGLESKDECLLGCCLPTFQRTLQPPSSGRCMQTTRCNNPEDSHILVLLLSQFRLSYVWRCYDCENSFTVSQRYCSGEF